MSKVRNLSPTLRGTILLNCNTKAIQFKDLDLLSKVAILGSIPLDLVQKLDLGQKPVSLEDEDYLLYYKKYKFLKACLSYNIPNEFKSKIYSRYISLFGNSSQHNEEDFFKKYLDYGDFVVHDLYNQANLGVKFI